MRSSSTPRSRLGYRSRKAGGSMDGDLNSRFRLTCLEAQSAEKEQFAAVSKRMRFRRKLTDVMHQRTYPQNWPQNDGISIDDIPYEMLAKILGYFDTIQQRKLERVNSRWRDTIRSFLVKKDVYLDVATLPLNHLPVLPDARDENYSEWKREYHPMMRSCRKLVFPLLRCLVDCKTQSILISDNSGKHSPVIKGLQCFGICRHFFQCLAGELKAEAGTTLLLIRVEIDFMALWKFCTENPRLLSTVTFDNCTIINVANCGTGTAGLEFSNFSAVLDLKEKMSEEQLDQRVWHLLASLNLPNTDDNLFRLFRHNPRFNAAIKKETLQKIIKILEPQLEVFNEHTDFKKLRNISKQIILERAGLLASDGSALVDQDHIEFFLLELEAHHQAGLLMAADLHPLAGLHPEFFEW